MSARARRWLAVKLVRWAGRCLDASYGAYCRRDAGEVPGWWDRPWAWYAVRVNRLTVWEGGWALRLDCDAALDEMMRIGWWV
jgi:hypothetical protein